MISVMCTAGSAPPELLMLSQHSLICSHFTAPLWLHLSLSSLSFLSSLSSLNCLYFLSFLPLPPFPLLLPFPLPLRLTDRSLFQPLVYIAPLPSTDSSTLHLLAVSSAGGTGADAEGGACGVLSVWCVHTHAHTHCTFIWYTCVYRELYFNCQNCHFTRCLLLHCAPPPPPTPPHNAATLLACSSLLTTPRCASHILKCNETAYKMRPL